MNENKYGKYLPIGTIVLLKNGKKKTMITGFCTADKNKMEKFYDYNGCPYPEGIVSSNMTLLFDHNQIDKIYHLGYRDNEQVEFMSSLKELISKNINK